MPFQKGVPSGGGRKTLIAEFNLIKAIDAYAPLFWATLKKWLNSSDKNDQKFAIQEFNKLQLKRMPNNINLEGSLNINSVLLENIKKRNEGITPTIDDNSERDSLVN